MKIGKSGLGIKIVSQAEFWMEFQARWYKGRVAYESIISGEIYTAREHDLGIEMIPFPPMYKVNICVDPSTNSGYVECSNISVPTQNIINDFVSNVFNQYQFDKQKEYQIHVRLDIDWNLRKVSIINCIGYEEDLMLTCLISNFFKTLAQGKNVNAFLTRLNLQKLLSEQADGTMV